MERSVTDITLELARSYSHAQVTVKRGDTHRSLRIHLVDGGRPYPLEGNCTAIFTAVKPDGSHLYNACRVEDAVVYDLTPQTTAIPGQLECELRLYGEDGALLTSAAFVLTVADTVYADGDENIASTGEATALTKLVSEATEKLTQMDAALKNEANHAIIDDTEVGADAWSAKNIVDKLCPAFTQTGSVVTCAPLEGYPLEVVSAVAVTQAGSGTPSPTNIRSVSGVEQATLTREGAHSDTFCVNFGQTVCGGSYDWTTGVLTVDHVKIILTGEETVAVQSIGGYSRFRATPAVAYTTEKSWSSGQYCSHFNAEKGIPIAGNHLDLTCAVYQGAAYFRYDAMADAAAFKAFLAEQYAAGTPVTFIYKVKEPTAVQLDPRKIPAQCGTNSFYSDCGDTTVTGRKDLITLLQNL